MTKCTPNSSSYNFFFFFFIILSEATHQQMILTKGFYNFRNQFFYNFERSDPTSQPDITTESHNYQTWI